MHQACWYAFWVQPINCAVFRTCSLFLCCTCFSQTRSLHHRVSVSHLEVVLMGNISGSLVLTFRECCTPFDHTRTFPSPQLLTWPFFFFSPTLNSHKNAHSRYKSSYLIIKASSVPRRWERGKEWNVCPGLEQAGLSQSEALKSSLS